MPWYHLGSPRPRGRDLGECLALRRDDGRTRRGLTFRRKLGSAAPRPCSPRFPRPVPSQGGSLCRTGGGTLLFPAFRMLNCQRASCLVPRITDNLRHIRGIVKMESGKAREKWRASLRAAVLSVLLSRGL